MSCRDMRIQMRERRCRRPMAHNVLWLRQDWVVRKRVGIVISRCFIAQGRVLSLTRRQMSCEMVSRAALDD